MTRADTVKALHRVYVIPLKSVTCTTILTLFLNGVPCNNSQRLTVFNHNKAHD